MQPLKGNERSFNSSATSNHNGHHASSPCNTSSNGTLFSMEMEDEDEDEDLEDSEIFTEQMHLLQTQYNNNIINNNHNDNNNIKTKHNHNHNKINSKKTKIFPKLPKKYNQRIFKVQHGFRKTLRLFTLSCFATLVFMVFYLPIYSNNSGRHLPIPDWSYNTSRNLADYILPDNDTTLLEPKEICSNKVFLMIVVCSSVQNFAARQIVRETWGNLTEFNYSMFPLLHRHLKGQYLMPSTERLHIYKDHFLETSDGDHLLQQNTNKNDNHLENQTSQTSQASIGSIAELSSLSSLTMKPSESSQSLRAATTDSYKSSNIFNQVVPNIKIVFLIGRNKDEALMGNETITRIHHEAMLYNDIIQENFIDSYNNLTIKTLFTLKWFKKKCSKQVAFLMKCDDDTFVNIPNLIHYLLGGTVPIYNDTYNFYDVKTVQTLAARNRLSATENLLVGHLFCTSKPVSDVNSKWYMPDYLYPEDTYPMYLSGAGYLMTTDIVQKLYETALNTTFIHLEDVYLTGIVAAKAGIRPIHHPLFDYTVSTNYCCFKGMLTQHGLKESLSEAYYFVANTTHHCPPPGKYLKKMRLAKPHAC